ncbi:hypothetical protein KJY73_12825 [Bowmanella sp. Y26]|uniref:hypothetical protein n=1 Tax=Bowmanella yangjiangensis TaxID=2811230 RepID=UPI001BDCB47E|nr:hypothetical protein [Bowmanella yangjiangensis]MBT1064465.1 hypothetical protein [Bowmanella yangjiangensis]
MFEEARGTMKVCYLLFLFSVKALATTCMSNDELLEDWKSKYSSEISIEVTKSPEGYEVLVWLPALLESKPLSSVVFHLGKQDSPSFSSQLAIFEEEGRKVVYYQVSAEQQPDGYLVATYGNDCGIQVVKAVVSAIEV